MKNQPERLQDMQQLRSEIDRLLEQCRQANVRAEQAEDRAKEAVRNFARIAPQHKTMRLALQSLGEQLLVPGNWHPTEAIACRGIVKAANDLEHDLANAREIAGRAWGWVRAVCLGWAVFAILMFFLCH
jgi:hypothetical protein